MNTDSPGRRDQLAAEYALGTLDGSARRRFERLIASDPELADSVQQWELRLNHLAESAPALEPPPRLWNSITEELWPAPKPERSSWLRRLWGDVRFWRVVGVLGAAAAAALAFHIALQLPPIERGQIAELSGRLTGISDKLDAADRAARLVEQQGERLERIDNSTQRLAETPGEIAAMAARLGAIEARLNATNLAPDHVAVLMAFT